MTLKSPTWLRRHKRISRRLGRELRAWMPYMAVALCFISSATAIVAAERTTL